MKTCKHFKKHLVLYAYNELTAVKRAELEVHLQICTRCRQELAELQQVLGKIPAQSLVEPPESLLRAMRSAVSEKIRDQRKQRWRLPSSVSKPLFPLFQGIAVCFVFLIGLYSGMRLFQSSPGDNQALIRLITGESGISTSDVAVRAYLNDVKKLNYNPKDQTVEIHYSTINKIVLKSPLQSAEVQAVLGRAILEKSRPAVRLDAIKAIQTIINEQRKLDRQLIANLVYLIKNEQNDGVRLQALAVLKTLPLNESLKEVFINVLLFDTNTALRIEAFKSLTDADISASDIDRFLKPLTTDNNDYFRFHANELLLDLNERISDL